MEIYQLPQGKITIVFSNEDLSIGLLKLNSNQELPKHNRPVKEELLQVSGSCVMKLFEDNDSVKVVALREGDSLEIPANQFHIHSNRTKSNSIILWKFEGSISGVIEDIRNNFKRVL